MAVAGIKDLHLRRGGDLAGQNYYCQSLGTTGSEETSGLTLSGDCQCGGDYVSIVKYIYNHWY